MLQALALLGGIAGAVNEFAFGKAEERERARYTIPLLEKAYGESFEAARIKFKEKAFEVVGAQMVGDDRGRPVHLTTGRITERIGGGFMGNERPVSSLG